MAAWVVPAVMAAGAVASHVTGERQIAEQRKARKGLEAAEAARQARIANIAAPELEGYDIPLREDLFNYSPELMQAIAQERSSLESYQGDPRFQQSQVDALQQLAELSQGGLTDADRLAMEEAQIEAFRADAGRQGAILQAMARRGMGGSGQELAARLASSQQAADSAAAQQRSQLQAAQARALQAMAQQGQLAGQIRGQGFDEASRRAAAADAINRFNTQNRMQTQAANIDARNRAALMRNQSAQQTADINRDIRERQAGQRNQMEQTRYENEMRREGLMGTPSGMSAQMQAQEAANRGQMMGQAIQSAIGAGTAFYGANQRGQQPMAPSGRTQYGEPIYG